MRTPTYEGIHSLSTENMSTLLGALNREPACIVLAATPTELTPIREITEDLRDLRAFQFVDRDRFNIHELYDGMPELVVRSTDPANGINWVAKNNGPTGELATGFAGSLLEFSEKHGIALRTLIGEKVAQKGNTSSIETRLGVIATVVAFSMDGDSFTSSEVSERVEDFGINGGTAKQHIYRLDRSGYLEKTKDRRYKPATMANGENSAEVMSNLLYRIITFAVGSTTAIEQGQKHAEEVLNRPGLLARLIEKSYNATGHTGKNTPRSKQSIKPV